MDDELRQAFATISAQMADVGNDARNASQRAQEAAHETTRIAFQMQGLRVDVDQLKVAVYGSNPPPAPVVPVVKRITHSEGDIAELAGQVISVKAELGEVKAINEAQTKELVATKALVVAGNADTSAIKVAIDDFVKKNPKAIHGLLWGLVGLIGAALAAAAAWFRGGK